MLSIFLFTLLIGLWAGGFFERFAVNFAFVQNFSIDELKRLNGKKVREKCEQQTEKEKVGKIIGYSYNSYALSGVRVKWEGQLSDGYTEYPKNSFLKYVEIAE